MVIENWRIHCLVQDNSENRGTCFTEGGQEEHSQEKENEEEKEEDYEEKQEGGRR